MLLTYVVVLNVINAFAEQNFDSGYCDIKTNSCTELNEKKYIFYDVNPPEGFNLRRDVYMRYAIMVADAKKIGFRKNWSLVLPPWFRLYHWTMSERTPVPWSNYFDIKSLKRFAPVVELYDIIKNTKDKFLIDTLYILQNFEDPFEGGTFVDKWEINNDKNCFYDGLFWGYKNINAKEIICVKFQGKISKLWELIALHPFDKKVMFAHGEIPLHDTYGTKTFWDCRRSMKFNEELIKAAEKYISEMFNCVEEKCNNYVSVHWRRQDFARGRSTEVPTITGTVKQIDRLVKRNFPNIKNIFIATDASHDEKIKLEKQLKDLNYKVYFYMPSKQDFKKFQDGGVAIIEQIICSHAAYFIGTHDSTFSFRIQEEREILGFDSETTFNRLCPDKGKCEKPSLWQIIK